jgi:hypothetical protein
MAGGEAVRRRCPADAEDPARAGDVLHRLLAQVLQHDPSLSRTESRTARNEDAARIGQRLEPRGDVDTVAVDVVAFDDHVTQVDADAEFDAAVIQRGAVAVGHAGLDGDGAAHGLDGAGEIHQETVAGALDDAAAMGGDVRFDDLAEMRLEEPQRALLVVAHQPAVTDHVGRQDRG